MWFAQAPVPQPTPTVYMYVDQVSSASGGLPPWVTSVAPFVVSLLALGGVVWSSIHSARTTLKAEDKRAKATIDAEDRRAKAATDAEDRRHQHQIEHDERAWHRTARADAYFHALGAVSRLIEAHTQFIWFTRPKSEVDKYQATNHDKASDFVDLWNESTTDIRAAEVEILAVGNPEVVEHLVALRKFSDEAMKKAIAAMRAAAEDLSSWPGDDQIAKSQLEGAQAEFDRITKLVREDLGAQPARGSVASPPGTDTKAV